MQKEITLISIHPQPQVMGKGLCASRHAHNAWAQTYILEKKKQKQGRGGH